MVRGGTDKSWIGSESEERVMKKKLPVLQQKFVHVPAFTDDLVPFVERGGAVG